MAKRLISRKHEAAIWTDLAVIVEEFEGRLPDEGAGEVERAVGLCDLLRIHLRAEHYAAVRESFDPYFTSDYWDSREYLKKRMLRFVKPKGADTEDYWWPLWNWKSRAAACRKMAHFTLKGK